MMIKYWFRFIHMFFNTLKFLSIIYQSYIPKFLFYTFNIDVYEEKLTKSERDRIFREEIFNNPVN